MSKSFKFLGLIVLLVGLMTGSAFAGSSFVNHVAANTPITVSLEAMGAARNVTLIGPATNGPILYQTSQSITSGNFLSVSLTGGAFSGDTVRVCKTDVEAAGNNIGLATPAGGATSYNFQLTSANNSVPAASNIYLTTDGACNTLGGASNMIVQISTSASASTPSLTMSIVSAGSLPIDASSTATLATIRSEYAATITAANHTIDYLGTVGNGTLLLPGTVAWAASNGTAAGNLLVNIVRTANNFTTVGGAANATNAGLTAAALVGLTDSALWQGVSKVFLVNQGAWNGTCTDNAGGNFVGTGSLNGTLSLAMGGAFNGGTISAGSANMVLCVVANGTTALNTRTITGSLDINVTGTGANDPAAPALVNADVWTVNAFQAMIPWAVNASTIPTYCHIANASTSQTATVILDVLSSEGGVTLSNASLGTIAPVTSKLMTITANSVSLAGGAVTDLTSLGTDKRHMDRVTVTTAPANVTLSCIQTDPVTGGKRNVLTTP